MEKCGMLLPVTPQRHRGSVYVTVLGLSLLLTTVGLGALAVARLRSRAAAGTGDGAEARLYALSAIELGRLWAQNDANWRTNRPAGVWAANQPIGSGTFTLEVVNALNPAYPLYHAPTDPVIMTGTGFRGMARQKTSVRLVPLATPLGCLGVSLMAGHDLALNSAVVTSDQTIAANNNLTGSGSIIRARAEVVGTYSVQTYQSGLPVKGVAARSMPAASVFDSYVAEGSAISLAAIPSVGGKKTIQNVVISPKVNPYGSTNEKGVYILDAAGKEVRIGNARVVGTLIVLNASLFVVQNSIAWEAEVSNYPALLVNGQLQLSSTTTALSEAALNVNFNPPEAPYKGVSDADKADTYPSAINGLIYAANDITTSNGVVVNGVVITDNDLVGGGGLTLSYRSTWYDNPPPGFGASSSRLQPAAGSWQSVVD